MRINSLIGVVVLVSVLFVTAFSAEVTAAGASRTEGPPSVQLGNLTLLLAGDLRDAGAISARLGPSARRYPCSIGDYEAARGTTTVSCEVPEEVVLSPTRLSLATAGRLGNEDAHLASFLLKSARPIDDGTVLSNGIAAGKS